MVVSFLSRSYSPVIESGILSSFRKEIAGFRFKLVISENMVGEGLHISRVLHFTAKQKEPSL